MKDLLSEALKDDPQAQEAMKGLAQMMQMMGNLLGKEDAVNETELNQMM